MENKKVLCCDIGGVVRNTVLNEIYENAVETLKDLSDDYKIIFISKCSEYYKASSETFLKKHNLKIYDVYYCENYDDKINIAKSLGATIMIDDLQKVLNTFPNDIVKIWFCDDIKKVEGAKKYQPEFFNSVIHAWSWEDVKQIITDLNNN